MTTTGRRTGRPHTIEIWFVVSGRSLYLMAGGRHSADWVRNLMADPAVRVRVREEEWPAAARVVEADTAEDTEARRRMLARYTTSADDLVGWGGSALVVAVDLPGDPSVDG
ncbi:MAG: nitroreductase family deazaflavin-dependent oxidoreductase [Acidimicrobiia bacterium]